jgi:rhamnosyltransferase
VNKNCPKISIIVRTHNEERWISHCLEGIFNQDFDNFEVILVDNKSSDFTVNVAKRYPIKKFLSIEKFIPGRAINRGIHASSGDFIVCISAHCVPTDNQWLKKLYLNFKDNSKLAGVYGRQIPVSFTSDADKRDLLITFGQDKKVQVKDYFFHNANSMFPRSIWEKFPFSETATNIEDRIWGKEVLQAGFQIIYEPDAQVYHHHGLHQHGKSSDRAKGIATILDNIEAEGIGDLPKSLKPEFANFAAVLPVTGEPKVKSGIDFLQRSIDYLKNSKYIDNIYVLTNNENVKKIALQNNAKVLNRADEMIDSSLPLAKKMQNALTDIESLDDYPEGIVYMNYLYPFRPENLIDNLIIELQYKGLQSVFSSYIDYGNYWKEGKDGGYSQLSNDLMPRSEKSPLYRALYGVGCVSLTTIIRSGRVVGDKVGIIPMDNLLYALRLDDEHPSLQKITLMMLSSL